MRAALCFPRYLPAYQLAAIEEQIHALEDPYQHAANLIARWVGPRRREIQRLELDCLGTHPDGHPRLRIPVGKTYTERIVPLHPEAAAALRECINATRSRSQRPLIDEVTDKPTHYVFQIRGRLMSDHRLFDSALRTACDNTGLVDHTGAELVTSHRFRHTVGTQLTEQEARLQTIMSILGHSSSTMSLIYARITDTTVLQDCKDTLQPGAQIAGPAAAALRNNELPQTTIDQCTATTPRPHSNSATACGCPKKALAIATSSSHAPNSSPPPNTRPDCKIDSVWNTPSPRTPPAADGTEKLSGTTQLPPASKRF
ncbi:site-specific integrase [Nocardia vinacea]|uniref:Site-specific integrase n=1 Tax=Nocardia vinacea TaxID=96468 RepID=A0ABZ1YW74_9NOCA|nr:tyrosine-type recombinase/integrase [Nocardia vinacea]